MDGTLWDSAKAVADCWTEVLKNKYNALRTITVEDMQSVMGKTMDDIADALFPMVDEEQRMQILKDCCEEENVYLEQHGAVLYDGLEKVLQSLQKDYHLYIVSNCQSGYIEAFLTYYGFEQYFDDMECFGNNNQKKGDNICNVFERNGLDKAVYVGDVQGDYDASTEAGIPFIHAAYGFGTINEEVPAISCMRELPERAKEYFEA